MSGKIRLLFASTNKFLRLYSKNSSDNEKLILLKEPLRKDPKQEISPQRILTGTETVPAEKVVGPVFNMPEYYRTRRVARISQRSKSVMQQGIHNTKEWILEFENEERWENPTIGWCSSGDSLSNIYMEFPSLSSAIHFAQRNGLNWYHDKPHCKVETKKAYADNFTWNKRTRVSTK